MNGLWVHAQVCVFQELSSCAFLYWFFSLLPAYIFQYHRNGSGSIMRLPQYQESKNPREYGYIHHLYFYELSYAKPNEMKQNRAHNVWVRVKYVSAKKDAGPEIRLLLKSNNWVLYWTNRYHGSRFQPLLYSQYLWSWYGNQLRAIGLTDTSYKIDVFLHH